MFQLSPSLHSSSYPVRANLLLLLLLLAVLLLVLLLLLFVVLLLSLLLLLVALLLLLLLLLVLLLQFGVYIVSVDLVGGKRGCLCLCIISSVWPVQTTRMLAPRV